MLYLVFMTAYFEILARFRHRHYHMEEVIVFIYFEGKSLMFSPNGCWPLEIFKTGLYKAAIIISFGHLGAVE